MFYSSNGEYKLGDFNISKEAIAYRTFAGSPSYMAPEVYRKNTDATKQADIYSFGMSLYHIMNRCLPFEETLIADKAFDVRMSGRPLPPPKNTSEAFAKIILKACAFKVSDRYNTIDAMLDDLKTLNSSEAIQDPYKTTVAKSSLYPNNEIKDSRNPKKWRKILLGITVALCGVVIIGGGIFAGQKIFFDVQDTSNSDTKTSATRNGVESDLVKEKISSAIANAEKLSKKQDYEGALNEIRAVLAEYPESSELKAKETEYTKALAEKIKTETLKAAETLSESGDYASAIALIKNAQDTDSEDVDYINALNTYTDSYRTQMISAADELADKGDYLGAIKKIKETVTVIGEDLSLKTKIQSYEKLYVTNVITKADELIVAEKFDEADKLVNSAKENFPDNEILHKESEKILTSRPVGSEEIMKILSSSVLSDSGKYQEYLGSDSINVFAEDKQNAFSIHTLVSYNIWGNNIQSVNFKISEFTFDILKFNICGKTGSSGKVTVDVFIDRPVDESSPDYSFTLEDAAYPLKAEIDVSNKNTMAFRVTNHVGNENCIVFYDFEGISS